MTNLKNLSSDAVEYFNSLPKFVQENIMQSGVTLNSKSELEMTAANLTR